MKKIVLSLVVLLLCVLGYAQTVVCTDEYCKLSYEPNSEEKKVIEEIKRIDNEMLQGTVEVEGKSDRKNQDKSLPYTIKRWNKIYYSKDGLFRDNTFYYQTDGLTKCNLYFDGKDYVEVYDNQIELSNSEFFNNNLYNKSESLFYVINYPSIYYGRGLSYLKDISYNKERREISGIWLDGSKMVATVDPNYQYVATSIKRYGSDNKFIGSWVNSKPLLVDGKYYILTNSIFTTIFGQTVKNILSATFNPPKKSDYTYDIKKYKGNIIDLRDEKNPAIYMPGELKNKSLDEIAKITKEKVERKLAIQKEFEKIQKEEPSNNNPINTQFVDYKPELLEKAIKENKPVILKFTADWCGVCKMLEKGSLSNEKVLEATKGVLLLKVDFTDNNNKDNIALQEKYKVEGYPTLIFIRGKKVIATLGYSFTDDILKNIADIKSNKNK